jgi:DNA-binding LacI/PurR family transcriptional regulator
MPESDEPKYQRLRQAIAERIRDQTWRPGDRLPPESSLCETYGVSRITVQRAKADLVAAGLIERRRGRKGHFVRSGDAGRAPSGLIGVIIDDVSIPFAAGILKGIEDRLRDDSLHTVISSGNYSPPGVRSFLESVCERGADGFIFTAIPGPGYEQRNRELILSVAARRLPLVFVDRFLDGRDQSSVASDNFQASYELTRRMLADGRTRILLLRGVECSSMLERERGYTEALRAAGRDLDPRLALTVDDFGYMRGSPERERVRADFHRAMESVPPYDACFCLNSTTFDLLNGFITRHDEERLRALSIGVYDFTPTENLRFPFRLCSVVQPTYRIGWEAANILVRSMRDPDQPVVQMTVKSTLRSCP